MDQDAAAIAAAAAAAAAQRGGGHAASHGMNYGSFSNDYRAELAVAVLPGHSQGFDQLRSGLSTSHTPMQATSSAFGHSDYASGSAAMVLGNNTIDASIYKHVAAA